MRSLRVMTFVYVVLFLEFNQLRDAEKVQFSQISQKLARTEI